MLYEKKEITADMLTEKMARTWNDKLLFIERALSEAAMHKISLVKLTKDNVISPFEFVADDIDYHPCTKCPLKIGYASILSNDAGHSCQNPHAFGHSSYAKGSLVKNIPDCFIYTDSFGVVTNLAEQVLFLQNKKPSERARKLAGKFEND